MYISLYRVAYIAALLIDRAYIVCRKHSMKKITLGWISKPDIR